jgi:tRNA pseudouridine55 synthase
MNGVLLIDKPLLFTSHDVVEKIRRKIDLRRVGHAGTLDPLATGLLVILIGQATKRFDELAGGDKAYEGMMTLGIQTDTLDMEGKITASSEAPPITKEKIIQTCQSFVGSGKQQIPQYASAKIHGSPFYALARKNISFERPLKPVSIKHLDVQEVAWPDVYFSVKVSRGTYVRALCDDIGKSLGVGATLSCLRRTQSGNFSIKNSLSWSRFKNLSPSQIQELLIP